MVKRNYPAIHKPRASREYMVKVSVRLEDELDSVCSHSSSMNSIFQAPYRGKGFDEATDFVYNRVIVQSR